MPNKEEIGNNIRSSVVFSIKSQLPKPDNGANLSERVKNIGLTIPDLAFLLNRSAGGFYNMFSENNERYKKGTEKDDLTIDIVVSYLEKMFEEKKQKVKAEKQKEKERVVNSIVDNSTVKTNLSLRDCKGAENKAKIMQAITNLVSQKEKNITYKKIAEITGLTAQQIAKIRESDSVIDEWFKYTNEVNFNEMQSYLFDIASENKYTRPGVSISAIKANMEYMKSNQKDKNGNSTDTENIWEKIKSVDNNDDKIIDVSPVIEINED